MANQLNRIDERRAKKMSKLEKLDSGSEGKGEGEGAGEDNKDSKVKLKKVKNLKK